MRCWRQETKFCWKADENDCNNAQKHRESNTSTAMKPKWLFLVVNSVLQAMDLLRESKSIISYVYQDCKFDWKHFSPQNIIFSDWIRDIFNILTLWSWFNQLESLLHLKMFTNVSTNYHQTRDRLRRIMAKLWQKCCHAISSIHFTLHQSASLQIRNHNNKTSKITVLNHNQ